MSRKAVHNSLAAIRKKRKQASKPVFGFFQRNHAGPARILLLLLLSLLIGAACDDESSPTAAPTAEMPASVPTLEQPQQEPSKEATKEPEITPTPMPPTPTPEPLAATVNGKPILLRALQEELVRYEQAQEELGLVTEGQSEDYTNVVLDALIETEIIAQAAAQMGIDVTDQMVADRIAELKESSGGVESFDAWLQSNLWTEEEFHHALKAEMVAEKVVGQVTADVPYSVEHVWARYLQVDDLSLAQSLYEQALGGADFAALAQEFSLDRVTGEDGGNLGFFARGTLLVPDIEEAAFTLEPGQLSEVISAPRSDGSGDAYYLVQLIERDPERELSAMMRSQMLQENFEAWLEEQWNQAEVARFIGEDQ